MNKKKETGSGEWKRRKVERRGGGGGEGEGGRKLRRSVAI